MDPLLKSYPKRGFESQAYQMSRKSGPKFGLDDLNFPNKFDVEYTKANIGVAYSVFGQKKGELVHTHKSSLYNGEFLLENIEVF